MKALAQPPEITWGDADGLVQKVYYEGEPFLGKPTRVFAYYGRPAEGDGPFPAVLLVHGGGGRAFDAWARHWAARGYVALAMDLAGCGPAGRLPDGGPNQGHPAKFSDHIDGNLKDMWTYHAVAAIIRGHTLLAARPEVDADRIAMTGISWGGYLTCIVAGLDDRLKAAVPVYGCGFLHENSCWTAGSLAQLTDEQRASWVEHFDPSQYLPGARRPMLWVNGTNDFAYPLDSYKKSYRAAPGPNALAITIRRRHGHIWTFPEVDAFIDSILKKDVKPLAKIGEMISDEAGVVLASVESEVPIKSAELIYTTDEGVWQKRNWVSMPATICERTVTAKLPTPRPTVYYINVTDERGLTVSTPHAMFGADH